ncbi:MAG: hypothetical protein FD131_4629 [Rhodocyclaceae bacterium]|nr:MAG: hypothetical protein FD131_4629 [Rhodocyclaceae bacterium]
MEGNGSKSSEQPSPKPRRTKGDLKFRKFRAQLFADESLLSFGTNEKGERVCYGVSIEKMNKAIDEGRF